MKHLWLASVLTLGLLAGCQSTSSLGAGLGQQQSQGTGLEGYVYKGPIQPACTDKAPCDAPFSGGFVVWQGKTVVAQFQSDAKGYFKVSLAPGSYTVTMDAQTQSLFPLRQSQSVEVGSSGMTQLTLTFDTGIR